jgi:hypothetical protein
MPSSSKAILAVLAAVLAVVWAVALVELPPLAANGLLHPYRRRVDPAAGHNQSLTAATWQAIERWLDDVLAGGGH